MAWGMEHGAQGSGHRAQGIGHRAQSTGHRAKVNYELRITNDEWASA